LPIAGLLYAILLAERTHLDSSAYSHLNHPHHPTVPHR
jgi:hypothetical protein